MQHARLPAFRARPRNMRWSSNPRGSRFIRRRTNNRKATKTSERTNKTMPIALLLAVRDSVKSKPAGGLPANNSIVDIVPTIHGSFGGGKFRTERRNSCKGALVWVPQREVQVLERHCHDSKRTNLLCQAKEQVKGTAPKPCIKAQHITAESRNMCMSSSYECADP